MKSYLVGRDTFTATIDMNFDETDSGQTTLVQGTSASLSSCQKEVHLEIESFLELVS